MPVPLSELLLPDTVLVAAGQRLARHLSHQYAREARERGLVVWETPTILTYGAWQNRCWQEIVEAGADHRLLLSMAQESVLWERIVADSDRSTQLLSASATARLAREAWMLLHTWELPRSELRKAAHEDVQAFTVWASSFEAICQEKSWLDAARLPDALSECIAQKQLRLPPRLILAGFDEFTPQQQRLIEALRRAGCDVSLFDKEDVAVVRASRRALPSTEEEILAAAQWSFTLLKENPRARIGILAPDLSSQNRVIRRVFDDVLLPGSVLPGQDDIARPYNVSLGESLASQPLVETAFAALELAQGALSISRLSELLRSPHLVGAEVELTHRALLDAQLRDDGDVRVSMATLARALKHAAEGVCACPVFAERLARFRETCATVRRAQPPSRWLAGIAQLLASLGWPGDRRRSSVEHQTIEAWRELLSEFGALDPVLPSIRYGEVLTRLRRMAQEKMFQRETPETPVQILGVLEASGLEFDALWVMGLHDEVWPSAPRPNPLLPVGLQRSRGLPHASAERELEFCARLTQRLLRSAPTAVLSYPRRDDDRDLRPSPLIRTLSDASESTAAVVPLYRTVIHQHSRCQTIVDDTAPALAQGAEARGGTALFRAQSACPFRAYAEFRLGAREFPEPQPGLGAADRGTLVHDLLARLWQELASQAELLATPADRLSARVMQLAEEEVQKLKYRRPETMTQRVMVLERERLTALVLEWLEVEKARAPFRVRREEAGTYLVVAGLRTKARMDRVDELAHGDLAVIDYKTGAARLGDWFGERPAEPQLPLYALYGVPPERVSAVFYGRVCRGEPEFVGLAREGDVAPGVKAYSETKQAAQAGPWEQLFSNWDATLVMLAQEHGAGHARVSPRNRMACERCHLHAFCRVPERRARLADAGDDASD